MEIFQIDTILLNILYDSKLQFVCNLLQINKHVYEKIYKYYKNGEIVFDAMPLFKSCNNISTYLKHYKSYLSGKNFPDNPLWLFEKETDCKCIDINGKYIKLENMRFDRPRFLNYFSNYEYIPFRGGLYYWNKLNDEQKYLIWCTIKGHHPEIQLSKMLIRSDNFIDLLSEIKWHYQKNFVQYYLEFYSIDIGDLMKVKSIAKNEIEVELEYYKGNHFLQEFKNSPDKTIYLEHYFVMSKNLRENKFQVELLDIIIDMKNGGLSNIRAFENINLTSDLLLKEINLLTNILNEIDEFTITKTNNLTTYNINYLTHMSENYKNSENVNFYVNQSLDLANACDTCKQQ